MARLIGPQPQGTILELRGPRDSVFTASAPDGLHLRMPAPNGKVDLWLAQAGDWYYEWQIGPNERGPSGTITVKLASEPQPIKPSPMQGETRPTRPTGPHLGIVE